MRSFIRVNGIEASVEGVRPVDFEYNNLVVNTLKGIFGQNAQFNIIAAPNFTNEENSENIFNGIIMGKYESEAPVTIQVFTELEKPIEEHAELPEPNATIAAFLGFRK